MIVERVLNLVHDEVRHLAVDVARQLDEARFDAGLLGLPGQIERIDRDAVPAQAGAGIERHEPERLGGGGINHFPDVDAHAVAHQRHFVHQADVDHAERVFEQLHHFGHAGGTDRNHVFERLRIEQRAQPRAGGRDSADHLGDVDGLKFRIAGVDALGRKTQEELLAGFEAGPLEHGQHQFIGGSGISGGFQDHELARPRSTWRSPGRPTRCSSCPDLWFCASGVGTAMLMVSSSATTEKSVVAREFARFHQRAQCIRGNVLDVGFAALELRDFRFLDVDAGDGESGLGELDRQRQADVAQADDADAGGPGFDFFLQDSRWR